MNPRAGTSFVGRGSLACDMDTTAGFVRSPHAFRRYLRLDEMRNARRSCLAGSVGATPVSASLLKSLLWSLFSPLFLASSLIALRGTPRALWILRAMHGAWTFTSLAPRCCIKPVARHRDSARPRPSLTAAERRSVTTTVSASLLKTLLWPLFQASSLMALRGAPRALRVLHALSDAWTFTNLAPRCCAKPVAWHHDSA